MKNKTEKKLQKHVHEKHINKDDDIHKSKALKR